MRSAAGDLLAQLDDQDRALAVRPFADDATRRWLEYREGRRPGACLAGFTVAARKAAHRLLATALSKHSYAQAMSVVALQEVLDREEAWERGRHSGDYWIDIFGDPAADDAWAWRFEGHHLSVAMTVDGDGVSPGPLFLGANPACVSYAGRPVSRPLAPEEDLARALLDALTPAHRAQAVVRGTAPDDIRSGLLPQAPDRIEPLGVAASRLGPTARAALSQLVALYLDRLPAELAARQQARLTELHFAWEGPVTPGTGHYYRIQGDDLLIEYDNTQDDANHAHTVLRRPRSDFGADILGQHLRQEHRTS
jgi:Protein of unknown function (DUF3500)